MPVCERASEHGLNPPTSTSHPLTPYSILDNLSTNYLQSVPTYLPLTDSRHDMSSVPADTSAQFFWRPLPYLTLPYHLRLALPCLASNTRSMQACIMRSGFSQAGCTQLGIMEPHQWGRFKRLGDVAGVRSLFL